MTVAWQHSGIQHPVRCPAIPDGAGPGHRVSDADEVADGQAVELAVEALLALASRDQVQVEGADELEQVATVILIDSGEHLIQQDEPR